MTVRTSWPESWSPATATRALPPESPRAAMAARVRSAARLRRKGRVDTGATPAFSSWPSQGKSSGSTTRVTPAFRSRRAAASARRRATGSGVREPLATAAQVTRMWNKLLLSTVTLLCRMPAGGVQVNTPIIKSLPPHPTGRE